MNPRRIERLQELIKHRVAEVIDNEIADPRRGLITITRVKLDREMASCLVFWSLIGDDADRRKNERMLASAAGWVQKEVAKILHTRTVPRVKFVHDESLERAQRIDQLLTEIREERGDDAAEESSPDA